MKIEKIHIEKEKRVIIISDIHASLDLFKRLLNKVNYTPNDYLIINGDMCEKGEDSLEVVEYVRTLCNYSTNVHVTKGNCDVLFRYVENGDQSILPYIEKRKKSILNDMLAVHHKSLNDFGNLELLAQYYRQHFKETLTWLEQLPHAIETDQFIVVHAGIENKEDWQQTDETFALQAKAFFEKNHQADKMVIVGHWPVVNYKAKQRTSHLPLFDWDKKITAIDGGNRIKEDGQLNALIIQGNTYTSYYVDDLTDEVIIRKDHFDTTGRVGTVTYPYYEMETIQQEQYFTLCDNINLQQQQWIKNEYLQNVDGKSICIHGISTTFLSVQKSEKVWLLDHSTDGYILIKNSIGEIGWIPRDCVF
ncbi:metallophosphoesterase [Viridibacillus sp. NPDC096237]|uniref:metallophosphoesterase n=1 Tax=Viridibacillus sp. NPDC096237 TaxID=3390721 RepID=UPI003CFE1A18